MLKYALLIIVVAFIAQSTFAEEISEEYLAELEQKFAEQDDPMLRHARYDQAIENFVESEEVSNVLRDFEATFSNAPMFGRRSDNVLEKMMSGIESFAAYLQEESGLDRRDSFKETVSNLGHKIANHLPFHKKSKGDDDKDKKQKKEDQADTNAPKPEGSKKNIFKTITGKIADGAKSVKNVFSKKNSTESETKNATSDASSDAKTGEAHAETNTDNPSSEPEKKTAEKKEKSTGIGKKLSSAKDSIWKAVKSPFTKKNKKADAPTGTAHEEEKSSQTNKSSGKDKRDFDLWNTIQRAFENVSAAFMKAGKGTRDDIDSRVVATFEKFRRDSSSSSSENLENIFTEAKNSLVKVYRDIVKSKNRRDDRAFSNIFSSFTDHLKGMFTKNEPAKKTRSEAHFEDLMKTFQSRANELVNRRSTVEEEENLMMEMSEAVNGWFSHVTRRADMSSRTEANNSANTRMQAMFAQLRDAFDQRAHEKDLQIEVANELNAIFNDFKDSYMNAL
eukprot:Nk52_evm36s242 gene=Nk52_evmTU36s242